MKRDACRAAALLILTTILVPTGLPLRAENDAGASLERGRQLLTKDAYAEAERELRRAVQELRGAADPRRFAAEANLGVAMFGLARYSEAESAYVGALESSKEWHAAPTSVAAVNNNLAVLYGAVGKFEAAERIANKVLSATTGQNRADRVIQANALNTLAGVYHQTGRYREAEEAAWRAAQILSQAGVQLSLAAALEQLAISRQAQNDIEGADRLLSQVREIRESQLSGGDPRIAEVYAAIGALRLSERRYAESEELLSRAIAIWKETGVPDPGHRPAAINNLAQVHKATGAYAKAEAEYREALQATEQTVGKKHPTYALFLGNFADLMRLEGRLLAAERLYDQAISVLEGSAGPSHPALEQFQSGLTATRALLAAQPKWTVDAGQLRRGFR